MADDRSGGGRSASDVLNARGLAGKRDYVRSLESRRDEEALTLLVGCLSEESGYLRELAEAALEKLGERSGPALLPLLDHGLWFSRVSAARVLGRTGYAEAAGPLVRLARDRVETVAREAYHALAGLAEGGATVRVAWELHRLPPEQRPGWLSRLHALDRTFAERLERLLRAGSIMALADPAALRDDAPAVRAALEETGPWDVPAGQAPARPAHPAGGADPSPR